MKKLLILIALSLLLIGCTVYRQPDTHNYKNTGLPIEYWY